MRRLAPALRAACALAFVAACSSAPAPAPSTPPGAPGPGPGSASAETPPLAATAPGIGEPCASGSACAQGLTCIRYYGIAGPRGPAFESCEIRCDDKTPCPDGRACVTVADGPGQVCR